MQPVGLIILIVLASLAVVGVIAWTLGGRWMRPGTPRARKREAPAPGAGGVRTNREVKRVVVPARGGDIARIVAARALAQAPAEAAPATASVAPMAVPAATELAAPAAPAEPAESIESVDGAIDTSTGDTTWPSTSWHSTSFHNTTWPATQPFALSQVPSYLAETEPMPLETLTTAR